MDRELLRDGATDVAGRSPHRVGRKGRSGDALSLDELFEAVGSGRRDPGDHGHGRALALVRAVRLEHGVRPR
jgi:hypothetical protein